MNKIFAGLILLLVFVLDVSVQAASNGGKRVEIDKTNQLLRAYEGNRLILQSHISTGRYDRSTPNGSFLAGGKERMHYSRLYDNAPMPYSVHVTGNCFIHGFSSVPNYPASHGCVRMPVDAARKFFSWVEPGTPIYIGGHWSGSSRAMKSSRR